MIVITAAGLVAWLGGNLGPGPQIGAGLDEKNNGIPPAPAGEIKGVSLYLVEFERVPGEDQLSSVTKLVQWAGNASDTGLPVRAGADQVRLLQDLPYVSRVSLYPLEYKLAGELHKITGINQQSNENTTGDDGHAATPGVGDPGNGSPKDGKGNEEPVPGQTSTPNNTVDTGTGGDLVEVVVTLVSAGDKTSALELVDKLGGRVVDGAGKDDRYLRAELPPTALAELAASPLVLYLEAHHAAQFLNDRARDITGARPVAVPGFITEKGLTGAGQTIGLADSGLDTGDIKNLHPDLANEPGKKPRIVMLKSWAGVDKPVDTIGHGTHMAGTLVGSGAASDGKYAGLAPDASLYFQGVVDENGKLALPVNLASLYRPAYDAGVRVHVNGWGRKVNQYSSAAAQVDEFVRRSPDFLPVFGAGNFGPGKNTITAEANSKNALVVGATANPRPAMDPDNTDTTGAVDFSSRGPAADGRIKPELLAPGTSVISTASSNLGGNLPGRNDYSVMQGTSMASATAGGAAALLRQYLAAQPGTRYPSAALLKAALVNGARPAEDDAPAAGFGVLDLAGTIIALQEKTTLVDDNYTGIVTGEFIDYQFEVPDSGTPFKATLAWSDPAAAPGAARALVNNLDLLVITPRGERYFGNHHLRPGIPRDRPDDVNNVEQVYIPDPEPGQYTVRVYGRRVSTAASLDGTGLRQDYAVVYGLSAPGREVEGYDEKTGRVFTAEGDSFTLPARNTYVALNDELSRPDARRILPGTRLYKAGDSYYFVTRYWRGYGLQLKKISGGLLWNTVDRESGDGGYYSGRTADITVNGEEYREDTETPTGFEAGASVDPVTQEIKVAGIRYLKEEGFVKSYESGDNTLQLLQDDQLFRVAANAVFLYDDSLMNTDPLEAAFGPATTYPQDMLSPGMPVRLIIAPSTAQVQGVVVKRAVVVGAVEAVDAAAQRVTVNGRQYNIVSGTQPMLDNEPVDLAAIEPGNLATLFLVTEKGDVAGLSAYSRSITGRVNYIQSDGRTIYLAEPGGSTRELQIQQNSVIRRWGMDNGMDALTEGLWARVILSPDGEEVWQVHCAETLRERDKKLAEYNEAKNSITTADGITYYLGAITEVSKNGYPVPVRELKPGDRLDIVSLLAPHPVGRAVLELVARAEKEHPAPQLQASGVPFEKDFWITGSTTGTTLYLYQGGSRFQKIGLTTDGQFAFGHLPSEGKRDIYLVAVDRSTGAVTGTRVNLAGGRSRAFTDITGHWAESELNKMAEEGLISGYPGSRFLPGQTVTRVEFTAMLARGFGWYSTRRVESSFADGRDIPRWARQAVAGAVERNAVAGYPDGTFRPLAPVTRVEEAAMLARILAMHGLEKEHDEEDCYADMERIPAWAQASVRQACASGIMKGRDGGRFDPLAPATRAETAVTIYRVLQAVRDNRSS